MSQKSDRHWYPRYPGDYARKTAHLSLVEHGAYALLMDWYYSNGKPLPDDWVQMHRICKAIAPDEQAAVQTIVRQFFTQTDTGWSNGRADEEIQRKAEISDKRRNAQRQREQNRLKQVSKAGAKQDTKQGANALSNAHTTTSTLNNSNELSPPTPKQRPTDLQTEFAAFYAAYPHNVGRDAALKAYQRALKGEGVTHAILIDGAQRFAAAHTGAGTEKRFIPHPATWLNAGRWQDDLDGITTRSNAPRPAANARGSQFGHLKSALSNLLQETPGDMADGPAGLPERGMGAPLGLQSPGWDRSVGLPHPADRDHPAGGPSTDQTGDWSTDG